MRDIAVTAVVFAFLPLALRRPYVGIYLWAWLGFMNPHRLCWGFAYDFPFAYLVAAVTLIGMFFFREPKKIPWTRETVLLLVFILWMLLTTFFALHPEFAWPQLEKVIKIQLMIFATLMLITTKERLNILVWVVTLSVAFYGIKGGIFTVTHGGSFNVKGPGGTFFGENNAMGLALVMTIPLLRYLQLTAQKKWQHIALTAAMVLCAIATIGSQSRGALLGASAMALFLWLKSRNKFFTGLVIAVSAALVLSVMPAQWHQRMSTIQTYEQDQSAMGRINAWQMAFGLAKDRLLGGGFETFQADAFAAYAPDPDDVHDAHSIYFEVLGEHGFVGLALFLLLGLATWRSASWVIKTTKRDPDRKWAADLAAMVQVSMVGYAVGGAFLGLAYFDLYYNLIVFVVLSKLILSREQLQPQPVPAAENGKVGGWRRKQEVETGYSEVP